MRKVKTFLAVWCWCALASIAPSAEIARVIDGDTVQLTDGRRVRLTGIDAPERGQPSGTEAAGWLRILVDGRRVELIDLKPSTWGRYQAIVTWQKMDVNEVMVRLGWAWVDDRYVPARLRDTWTAQQNYARARRVGLWRYANPIPPWDWRSRQRSVRPIPFVSGGG